MKNVIILSYCLFFSALAMTQSLDVMSFNIRYNNPSDGENAWPNRRTQVANFLNVHRPVVVGMQEVLQDQLEFLDETLVSYTYIGVGREDGAQAGEFAPLFYDTTVVQLRQSGTFWLSPTPDQPSVGWDAALERICTYGQFEHKATGTSFWVFNAHFDHRGAVARTQSAQLILKKIKEFAGQENKLILAGDLNARPDESPLTVLKTTLLDSYHCTECVRFGSYPTFNGFRTEYAAEHRIDYVLVNPTGFRVEKYAVFSDLINGRFISDHFPVLVSLSVR